jgi:hypothetical protein
MTAAGRGDAPTPQDAATTVKRAMDARRRLHAALIAVRPLLDMPYPDDSRSPCTVFVRPAMGSVDHAIDDLIDALAASPVPVAADVPTPSAATQNDEAQR